jgi:hypothetical protein
MATGGNMRILDAQEQLVCDSEVSVAVLGKGRNFVLVPLQDRELDATELVETQSRGFFFCGVLGIKDGQPSAECSDPDAAIVMMHAALAFAQEMAGRLRPKDDSAAWCERLHALQDPRNG